jgi:choline dehydrogenase-like flavoprotein
MGSVVDAELRVLGLEGVRVVDIIRGLPPLPRASVEQAPA